MNKILVSSALVLSLFLPTLAFADSTVTATAGPGASVSPSGTTIVSTGATQTFTAGAATGYTLSNVSVDGVSQGPVSSVDFTGLAGNTTDTINVTAAPSAPMGGGGMIFCSGPLAPGWNVSLPDGGCGLPTFNSFGL